LTGRVAGREDFDVGAGVTPGQGSWRWLSRIESKAAAETGWRLAAIGNSADAGVWCALF
jgi:hypothetical protein